MTSLLLRPWRQSDGGALAAAYRASSDLDRRLDPDAETPAGAERVVGEDLGWDSQTACNLAIVADGTAVGNVGLSRIDPRHGTAWTYYWLAAPARGRGLAARATATLAHWAAEELQLHRLELGHRTNNPASCRVARSAGFAAEGIQRDKLHYDGERFDVEIHARLATDPVPALQLLELRLP
ncbi:GNAT family N-acetyltransferase [Arthrobacter sunyaminii]|uniref:GNAT family N-acetyltransferase n=1 Tax=Arthrobacter sunyaminii TaxID=2816859 RepID=A0A975S5Q0_9MICC|nr:GNAT family protein [Arthrobacter sunyaminii]MBO0909497.1 GNAT family N-acetyltransferase [Arthrobacter sunyaminii]QWQ36191.1 GNAT family N-acetyltransferase [Arthrobacter sunyaminii]